MEPLKNTQFVLGRVLGQAHDRGPGQFVEMPALFADLVSCRNRPGLL